MAGVLSWASVYPFDTIKSRMQASRYGVLYKGAPYFFLYLCSPLKLPCICQHIRD